MQVNFGALPLVKMPAEMPMVPLCMSQQKIGRGISVYSAHLTLLEQAIAVSVLSLCPSVKHMDCDKMK